MSWEYIVSYLVLAVLVGWVLIDTVGDDPDDLDGGQE